MVLEKMWEKIKLFLGVQSPSFDAYRINANVLDGATRVFDHQPKDNKPIPLEVLAEFPSIDGEFVMVPIWKNTQK